MRGRYAATAAALFTFGALTGATGTGCTGGLVFELRPTDDGGGSADGGCAALDCGCGCAGAASGACRRAPNDDSGQRCTLAASAYNQSCRSASDCVAVFLCYGCAA